MRDSERRVEAERQSGEPLRAAGSAALKRHHSPRLASFKPTDLHALGHAPFCRRRYNALSRQQLTSFRARFTRPFAAIMFTPTPSLLAIILAIKFKRISRLASPREKERNRAEGQEEREREKQRKRERAALFRYARVTLSGERVAPRLISIS